MSRMSKPARQRERKAPRQRGPVPSAPPLSLMEDYVEVSLVDLYMESIFPACVLFHLIDTKISDYIPSVGGGPPYLKIRGVDIITQYIEPADAIAMRKAFDEFRGFMKLLKVPVDEYPRFLDRLPIPFCHRRTNLMAENNLHCTRFDFVRHLEALKEKEMFVLVSRMPALADCVDKTREIFRKIHFPVCFYLRTRLTLDFDLSGKKGQRPMDIIFNHAKELISYCFRGQIATMVPLALISIDIYNELTHHCYLESFYNALTAIKDHKVGSKYERTMTFHTDGVPYIISFTCKLLKDDGKKNVVIDYMCRMYVSPNYAERESNDKQTLVTIPFLFEDRLRLKHVPPAGPRPYKKSDPPFDVVSDELVVVPLVTDTSVPGCCRCKALDEFNGVIPLKLYY